MDQHLGSQSLPVVLAVGLVQHSAAVDFKPAFAVPPFQLFSVIQTFQAH
jgi:hypothetical protein